MILKAGIFRLLTILVFLTTVFFILNLISLKQPLVPPAEKTHCPFVLAVSPPFTGMISQENRPTSPDEFNASPAPAKRQEVSDKFREIPETAGGRPLPDTGFFSTVLSHTRIENPTYLELFFYLPLHLTRDKRWLLSESPFMVRPATLTEKTPQSATAKRASTNLSGPSSKKAPFQRISGSDPGFQAPQKISRLTLQEIQKQLPAKKNPDFKRSVAPVSKTKVVPAFFHGKPGRGF